MASRSSNKGPQASGVFLCERVLQDMVSREAVTCVNIYNGLMAVEFPITVPVAYAFAQITGTTGPFDYEYSLLDENGTVMASSGRATVEPQEGSDEATSHKVISAFHGMSFDREGIYSLVLSIDGEEAASLPLKVVLVREPSMAGQ